MVKKLNKFTNSKDFSPEILAKKSSAARNLCQWVLNIQAYGQTKFNIKFKNEEGVQKAAA